MNNLVYIVDTGNNLIRVVNRTDGIIKTFAGNGKFSNQSGDGELATHLYLNLPKDIAIDNARNLVYIADTNNNVIRIVNTTNGVISTFAGQYQKAGFSGDGNLANKALLNQPYSVQYDSAHDLLYIADNGNLVLRVVNQKTGIITTFTKTLGFYISPIWLLVTPNPSGNTGLQF